MFERFTDVARRVVVHAQEEARLLNHNYIGTEHILVGLLDQEASVAARVLASFGLNREKAVTAIEEIVGPGRSSPSPHVPFTPRAKKVLELSLREAMQLGHNYIGSEHILLGLVREGEGVGAQVIRSAGANLSTVRQRVIELAGDEGQGEMASGMDQSFASASTTASAEMERDYPLCPICGSRLAETLRWRRVTAAATPGNEGGRETVVAFCNNCGRALGLLPP